MCYQIGVFASTDLSPLSLFLYIQASRLSFLSQARTLIITHQFYSRYFALIFSRLFLCLFKLYQLGSFRFSHHYILHIDISLRIFLSVRFFVDFIETLGHVSVRKKLFRIFPPSSSLTTTPFFERPRQSSLGPLY